MRSTDESVRKECSEWIRAFELSTSAWVLSMQLIAESETDGSDPQQLLAWWGAKMLYAKLKRQVMRR